MKVRRETKALGENPVSAHLVHLKSHRNYPVIETQFTRTFKTKLIYIIRIM